MTRKKNTILLSQTKYMQDLLIKTMMSDCKGIETSFSTTEKLKKHEWAKFHDPMLYISVIGSLQYVHIWHELAFSGNKLSKFMLHPR